MPVRLAVDGVDRVIAKQMAEWRQDRQRHSLNRRWRVREDDHVGKFPWR